MLIPPCPSPRSFLALLVTALLCACSPSTQGGADAGVVLQQSTLFGACTDDSQCPGVGAFCQKGKDGFPGGVCTKPCDDRTFCDAYETWNWCLPDATGRKVCVQRCLNGVDCSRDGYTCTAEIAGGAGSCYPVCSGNSCGPGAECNAASGKCVPAGALPKDNAANGQACGKDDDCLSGQCHAEVVAGQPTGWKDGMCVGPCILPAGWNQNTLYSGDALPPGTCAGNMVCYPENGYGRGSPGVCRPACAQDSDCRDGYECLKDFGVKTFQKGMCVRIDCTKRDCPTGYLCKMGDSGYVCAKSP